MIHKAWSSIWEVPYCFSRSFVKFQGHMGQKNCYFDPNQAFPDCNSWLNLPMALRWCTKLNIVQKRCHIVFQGHPSNFKVMGDKTITNFDPNWAFPDCNSSLTSPMDLEWCTKAWCSIEEVPCCFPMLSIKFQGHTGKKISNSIHRPISTTNFLLCIQICEMGPRVWTLLSEVIKR